MGDSSRLDEPVLVSLITVRWCFIFDDRKLRRIENHSENRYASKSRGADLCGLNDILVLASRTWLALSCLALIQAGSIVKPCSSLQAVQPGVFALSQSVCCLWEFMSELSEGRGKNPREER